MERQWALVALGVCADATRWKRLSRQASAGLPSINYQCMEQRQHVGVVAAHDYTVGPTGPQS